MRGAIFDCDGTLLDSMPMWTEACVGLLMRHGVIDAQRVFEERESLDMHAKCVWYHEHLGIGDDADALYHELWDTVERAYRTTVMPFSGCAEFLRALAERGVRMVLASATPEELVRLALEAHGLLEYFEQIVFVGDVGRDKDFPDVYLAAQACLGTARDETWVFEDGPFGVRAAARVGFPVVALYNDHDGRDLSFLQKWATVVACGYEGLSLAELHSARPRMTRALIVGGSPMPSSPALVASLASDADFVIAADGGANVLRASGVVPDAFCGDADSISAEALEWVTHSACAMDWHPRDKDATDLELAVAYARQEAERRGSCLRLTVTCVNGGRPDHALAVWGVLAQHGAFAPRMVEDGFECRILAPEGDPVWRIRARQGQTISVVALSCEAVVSEQGTHWTLDHERLAVLGDRGVSNRASGESCAITCHDGVLAAFVLG